MERYKLQAFNLKILSFSCRVGESFLFRFHIYRERAPVSTVNAHPYPPSTHTRIYLRLTPVSTSACHPCQPQSLTRINLRLPLVMFLEVTTAGSVKMRLSEA